MSVARKLQVQGVPGMARSTRHGCRVPVHFPFPKNTAMRSPRHLLTPLAVALGCATALATAHAADPMKVGFLYIGPASGAGWSYAHELARQEVQKKFGSKIETIFVENVAENDAERVTRDLAAQGAKVISGGAFGFMNGMERVSRDFPKVAFEHATGYKTGPNLGIYDIRTYEGACLNGTIAGHLSKTQTIGVVAPHPIPEIVRNINAFTQDGSKLVAVLANLPDKDKYEIPPFSISDEYQGIGVPKGETRLVSYLNDWLVELEKNGTAKKIYDKWYGPQSSSPLPRLFKIGDK